MALKDNVDTYIWMPRQCTEHPNPVGAYFRKTFLGAVFFWYYTFLYNVWYQKNTALYLKKSAAPVSQPCTFTKGSGSG